MFVSIDAFLTYFDAVNRRAMRDIGALPPEADGWAPNAVEGENAWSINKLIGHMAGSRLYFVSAYRGEGWISPEPPDVSSRDLWVSAIDESAHELHRQLDGTPEPWLERKVQMGDTAGALAGRPRVAVELEPQLPHHSPDGPHAGLNGWPVPDIYGRSAEKIGGLQDEQRAKHS